MSYRLIAKNGLWLIFGKVVGLALSFLSIVVMAREYGPELFGILSLAISVVALITPAIQLGLNSIVTRDLVSEPENSSSIIGTVLAIRATGAFICIVVSLFVLFGGYGGGDDLVFYILILLFGEFFKSGVVFSFWLESRAKGKTITFCTIGAMLVSSGLKIFASLIGVEFFWIVYIYAIEGLIIGLSFFLAYCFFSKQGVCLSVSLSRAFCYFKKCLPLIASSVTAIVYMKIDQVMIASIMDHASVGVYAVAARMSEVWYFIPIMISTAAFPTIIKARKDGGGAYEIYLQNIFDCLSLIGYAAAVGTMLLGGVFIRTMFGEQYAAAAPILMIHIWGGVFMSMRALASKWILVEDVLIYSLLTQGLGAVTNILLNLVLIPVYGLKGAAIATLVSYAVAGYFSFVFVKRTRVVFRMMSLALLSPVRLSYRKVSKKSFLRGGE